MGRTPLNYAVVGSHLETVDLLVFCGADSSVVNKVGNSHLDVDTSFKVSDPQLCYLIPFNHDQYT